MPLKRAYSVQPTTARLLGLLPSLRGRSELVHKPSTINSLQDVLLIVVSVNRENHQLCTFCLFHDLGLAYKKIIME